MYPKFCVIFPKFTPPIQGLFFYPSEMILILLYRKVTHMLPAKCQPYWQSCSGEEVVWMIFIIYGHGDHHEFQVLIFLAKFCTTIIFMLNMKFRLKCSVVSWEMSFKFFINGCHGNQSCHAIFIKTSYM